MMDMVSVLGLGNMFHGPRNSDAKAVTHISIVNQHFDGTINYLHPMVFATKNATNDTFAVKQALQQDDVRYFVQSILKEIGDHGFRDHWTLMKRSDLTLGTKTIMSIWSFKRKLFLMVGL